jgi:hypothetical protein
MEKTKNSLPVEPFFRLVHFWACSLLLNIGNFEHESPKAFSAPYILADTMSAMPCPLKPGIPNRWKIHCMEVYS